MTGSQLSNGLLLRYRFYLNHRKQLNREKEHIRTLDDFEFADEIVMDYEELEALSAM